MHEARSAFEVDGTLRDGQADAGGGSGDGAAIVEGTHADLWRTTGTLLPLGALVKALVGEASSAVFQCDGAAECFVAVGMTAESNVHLIPLPIGLNSLDSYIYIVIDVNIGMQTSYRYA
jgi:hypothetical protein